MMTGGRTCLLGATCVVILTVGIYLLVVYNPPLSQPFAEAITEHPLRLFGLIAIIIGSVGILVIVVRQIVMPHRPARAVTILNSSTNYQLQTAINQVPSPHQCQPSINPVTSGYSPENSNISLQSRSYGTQATSMFQYSQIPTATAPPATTVVHLPPESDLPPSYAEAVGMTPQRQY